MPHTDRTGLHFASEVHKSEKSLMPIDLRDAPFSALWRPWPSVSISHEVPMRGELKARTTESEHDRFTLPGVDGAL